MPNFKYHIFVCVNKRPDDNPKGCCSTKGSEDIMSRLKGEVAKRNLRSMVRVTPCNCLGYCGIGPTVVIYPEGTWYKGVSAGDVDEILEKHIVNGKPVERLQYID